MSFEIPAIVRLPVYRRRPYGACSSITSDGSVDTIFLNRVLYAVAGQVKGIPSKAVPIRKGLVYHMVFAYECQKCKAIFFVSDGDLEGLAHACMQKKIA